jgi:hypothetical protein
MIDQSVVREKDLDTGPHHFLELRDIHHDHCVRLVHHLVLTI